MDKEVKKQLFKDVASRVTDKLRKGEILRSKKTLEVTSEQVEDVFNCIHIGIIKGAKSKDKILIPAFGSFTIYKGRASYLDNREKLRKEGYDEDEVKKILKDATKQAIDQGVNVNRRNGFTIKIK